MSDAGFVIDMDGVVYRESEVIPGAIEWISLLIEHKIPFMFLTNNSQKTRRDVVTKLTRMGFKGMQEEHIFTCAMATARFLAKTKPNGTAYVIGEAGLTLALHSNGYSIVDSDPDYVVIGEGRTLNMEMLEKAVTLVLNGAKLIATNMDATCPVGQDGIRPGCGSYVAMLEAATGQKAFSVGKPSPIMMRAAKDELGIRSEHTYMIGDTMETDILGGIQASFNSILVLSGGTNKVDLKNFAYSPDRIIPSIKTLVEDKAFINHILEVNGRSNAAE
jgi:NagD protein